MIQTGLSPATVTIYFCPGNERVDAAVDIMRFWVLPTTTFLELTKNACKARYGIDPELMVLVDDNGAQWPVKRSVITETRLFHQRKLRLVQHTVEVEEQEEDMDVIDDFNDDVDEGYAIRSGRKPVWGELVLHLIFLVFLFLRLMPPGSSGTQIYELHDAYTEGFLGSSEVIGKGGTTERVPPFAELQAGDDMCNWFGATLSTALFESRKTSYGLPGSISTYNRLLGGLKMDVTTAPFIPDSCPFSDAYSSCNPEEVTQLRNEGMVEETTTFHLDPDYYPSGWMVNQSVLMAANYLAFMGRICEQIVDTRYLMGVESPVDTYKATFAPAVAANQTLKRVMLSLAAYSHNLDMYTELIFKFDFNEGGAMKPSYHFSSFNNRRLFVTFFLMDGKDIIYQQTKPLREQVLLRTRNEFNLARSIWKEQGSLWPYFSNFFTLLELFNLSLNYAETAGRLAYAINIWRHSLTERIAQLGTIHDTSITLGIDEELQEAAFLYNCVQGLNALLVITAVLITARFLELMPKLSFWYLTGSTVANQFQTIGWLLLSILYVIIAAAIIGEQLVGMYLFEFSSFYRAFCSVAKMFAGNGLVIKEFYKIGTTTAQITPTIWYLVIQYYAITLASPFFLAIINDSYAKQTLKFNEARQRAEYKRRQNMIAQMHK